MEEALEEFKTITALSHTTGIAQRRLFAIRHRSESEVGLEVADRLIAKSVGIDRWYEPDLRRWYFGDRVLS